ncbi:MAG: triphosphoribosyl-dephospho-CoA synthase [Candidatus Thorarchaeota archaeon]
MKAHIPWKIASLGQLSILLEVSSPKPGNVSRLRRFSDTGYRHFLASASLASRGFHIAASKGKDLAQGVITPKEVRVGNIIHECSKDVFSGLNQRNTIFGTVLLYVPLVIAAGATIEASNEFSQDEMSRWIRRILKNTTSEDTVDLYKAFHLIHPGGKLNKEDASWTEIHDRFDIDNPRVLDNIREDNMTLQELFKKSAEVDPICREWSEDYQDIITKVFPYLDEAAGSLEDLEEGIVRTFIWQLSRYHDGLILKKVGFKRAEEVRALAEIIVSNGMNGKEADDMMAHLDEELRREGNLLNPGTTADFVSAAIFCKLVAMEFNQT